MAYYENFPIYKKAFDLALFVENSVPDFSRYHKYSIGADMRRLSRNLVTMVIKANLKKDKLDLLTLRELALKMLQSSGKVRLAISTNAAGREAGAETNVAYPPRAGRIAYPTNSYGAGRRRLILPRDDRPFSIPGIRPQAVWP